MSMADKKRILVVTQEFHPFTEESFIANIVHQYAQYMQESDMEVRILMPRFGAINERRHRLHEVVRLSGMNITVDDEDYPLLIKVASLPGTRMQIYFLDNDEFFKRKKLFRDKDGVPFADNVDRMVFFCKGVIETVKKFGWAPDIIHCHGWMTSLLPAYLKSHYKNEPIFQNAHHICSVYNNEEALAEAMTKFAEKALSNQLSEEVVANFQKDGKLDLNHGAAHFSDGLIIGQENVTYAEGDMPVLAATNAEEGDWSHYVEFFNNLLLQTEESA